MRTIHKEIVTVLVYSQDNKLLMGRKDPQIGGVYPDCWHLPGGGVEEGETLEQAVIRELQEETGIDVATYPIVFDSNEDGDTLEKVIRTTGERVVAEMRFNVFVIRLQDRKADNIRLIPGDDLSELRWFTVEEVTSVKITPPSERFFRKRGYSI